MTTLRVAASVFLATIMLAGSGLQSSEPLGEVFVVVYHTDNRSWGVGPGPENTITGHLIFLRP